MRVRMTSACRSLIYDIYPDAQDRVDIEVEIERHLILLNREACYDDAVEFLNRTEVALREEFARKQKGKGREKIWIVARSTLPAFMLVVTKFFTDHWPLN
jgi:hypothetical protein